MNKRTKSFLLSILTLSFIFYSCSNLANDLQKRKNQNLFNITIQETSNGTVTAAKSSGIKAGEEVILSVTATSGYELKTISVTNTQNKDVAVAAMEQGTSYKFTMPNSDVTVSAIFEKQGPIDISNPEDLSSSNGNTLYRIEHYQQDVDDTSSYTLYAIQKKKGDAGTDTAASAKDYPGFTSLSFTQKKIAPDGSTVVEIYYNRKTITYTIEPSGGYWDGSEQIYEISGLYGAEVDYQNFTMNGYTLFTDENMPFVFGLDNITFSAHWNPNDDTKYTVKIYLENTSGNNNYTLQQTIFREGTTDTNTNYSDDIYGFNLQPLEQKNINGDESTVLEAYYKRLSFTVSLVTFGGSTIQNQEVLYQTKAQIPDSPECLGFTFDGWYANSTYDTLFDFNTIITENICLYAKWKWSINSITYTLHNDVTQLPLGTDGTFGVEGEYVLFGDFPQSKKTDEVNIIENEVTVLGIFTVYAGDDGNVYVKSNEEYYKIEPIKWRVLSKDSEGKAILLAENILFKSNFCSNKWDSFYKNSQIRNYLNNDFLNTVFYLGGYNLIEEEVFSSFVNTMTSHYTITVDQKERFFGTCQDRIYLPPKYLVEDEQVFSNSTRIRNPTDYAISVGCVNSSWTTRDSVVVTNSLSEMDDEDYYYPYGVSPDGIPSWSGVMGVVPSLSIYLTPVN